MQKTVFVEGLKINLAGDSTLGLQKGLMPALQDSAIPRWPFPAESSAVSLSEALLQTFAAAEWRYLFSSHIEWASRP